MIEVSKRGDEKVESMLRRFKKISKRSGLVDLARSKQYFEGKVSKNLARKHAIKRSELREEKDYLRKIGKIDSQTFR